MGIVRFKLKSAYHPAGDQPQAIKKLTENLKSGAKHQVLLGVTGSGKTATMAWTIEKIQKPTLVISHNKTLAFQLYQEFKEFFPENAVHYFVSYYDYYQPEAYIPQTDTYIEKDAKINEEIDRMRHAATQDLLTRDDVIIVASVSCIYNIGSPENYQNVSLELKQGQEISRKELLSHLIELQYQRNDVDFRPGTFRVRGEMTEIYSVAGQEIIRIFHKKNGPCNISKLLPEQFRPLKSNLSTSFAIANEVDRKKLKGDKNFEIENCKLKIENLRLYPAHFWVTPQEKLNIALENIRLELQERLKELKKQKKYLDPVRSDSNHEILNSHQKTSIPNHSGELKGRSTSNGVDPVRDFTRDKKTIEVYRKISTGVEAQRIEQRTNFDLEMMRETGWCHGIENYSRHLEFRKPGDPPFTLLDYFQYQNNIRDNSGKNSGFNSGFLTFIDESHMTIPQLYGMYQGDRSRKETLVEYGFRLPSAVDNRPLKFSEFEKKVGQVIYVSATPGPYEMQKIQMPRLRQGFGGQAKSKISIQAVGSTSQTGQNKFQILNSTQSSDRVARSNDRAKFQTKNPFLVEQLIRPTGLLEPSVEVRPTNGQIKDLIQEIKKRVAKKERTLVITLTKRMAEDLAEYLLNEGIKTNYLHSEIKTLERPEILRDLRLGKYDVIVGINLLREGLDLPEVALVAILDADKEGFLRNETTLIQTMGRAARHPEGHCILYADRITGSMKRAMEEVTRRRKIQEEYNKRHGIIPRPIIKPISRIDTNLPRISQMNIREISGKFVNIRDLEKEMKKAARNLDFEKAAEIRDLIEKLKP